MARRRFRSGRRRAPLRKWVWARSSGEGLAPDVPINLLEEFQAEYGAQLLGATVMRIRGYCEPFFGVAAPGNTLSRGVFGIIVEEDQELVTPPPDKLPNARPHDNWLAWLPWAAAGQDPGPAANGLTTGNAQASPYAVDVKAARKIEELGQGLHLWPEIVAPGTEPVWHYDLSIGLKLP